MTFASSSDITDLKDIVYGIDMRLIELELKMQELDDILTKINKTIEINKMVGRLK